MRKEGLRRGRRGRRERERGGKRERRLARLGQRGMTGWEGGTVSMNEKPQTSSSLSPHSINDQTSGTATLQANLSPCPFPFPFPSAPPASPRTPNFPFPAKTFGRIPSQRSYFSIRLCRYLPTYYVRCIDRWKEGDGKVEIEGLGDLFINRSIDQASGPRLRGGDRYEI